MKDETMASGRWEFNESVTAVFENMLERSIPQYDTMRELVYRIGANFIRPDTTIQDIGCSNGLSIQKFVEAYKEQNKFLLCDVSAPMLRECRKRYSKEIESGCMQVADYDIKNGIMAEPSSLILSILTLQFTPIEYRQQIITSIYNTLNKGGALILVEKMLGADAQIDNMLVQEYYKLKGENQYTQEQIAAKRKSLEGVLVPVTAKWNIDLLRTAGFSHIECFWRCLNFAGFVAVK